MTNNLIIGAFLIITACSSSANDKNIENTIVNPDTTYNSSTSQLKSNKIPDSVFQMINLKHLSVQGMDCDYGDHTTCWMIP